MAQKLTKLPLFPLETVLFPYATLGLHIFEPRYLEMIRICREEDRPFGIALLRHGSEGGIDQEPYLIGTVARIREVQDLPDGRLDIQIMGEDRFRIREIDRDAAPFLVGHVEPLVEDAWPDNESANEIRDHAQELFVALIRSALAGRSVDVRIEFPGDPSAQSFAMAHLVPLETIEKQHLLEMTDTVERFEEIVPALEQHLSAIGIVDESTGPEPLTVEEAREYLFPN